MVADEILEKIFSPSCRKSDCLKYMRKADSPDILLETLFIYFDLYAWMKNKDGLDKIFSLFTDFLKLYKRVDSYCRISFRKGDYFSKIGDRKQALRVYNASVKYAEAHDDLFYLSQAYMKLGHFFRKSADFEPITKTLEKEMKSHPDFRTGMLWKSLHYFTEAGRLFMKIGQDYNFAATVFNTSLMYYFLEKTDLAYSNAVAAREAGENIQASALLAAVFLHLANIHSDKKEFYMAKLYYRSAMDFFKLENNYLKTADIMYKIAWILGYEKNLSASIQLYRKALDLKVSLDYRQALGDFYFNRAMVMASCESYSSALKFFDRALFVFQSLGLTEKALFVKFNIFKLRSKIDASLSLYQFVSSYKPPVCKEILAAKTNISYHRRKRDSDIFEIFGIPADTLSVTRESLASMMRDMSALCWMSGDKVKSQFFTNQSQTVKSDLIQSK